MDELKMQLQRRLLANAFMARLTDKADIVFSASKCTQDRIIRFGTTFFEKLFGNEQSEAGVVVYEVYLEAEAFKVSCVLDEKKAEKLNADTTEKLMGFGEAASGVLKSWNYADTIGTDGLLEAFDAFTEKEISRFEKSLSEFLEKEKLREGEKETVSGTKYERNKKARNECISYHGTACKVCGIDFEKAYGPEFAGKIEVHHIVPISLIGEEYVVDPIKDLVPVCPNCHTALHSKKNGVYTVEELKKMRSN